MEKQPLVSSTFSMLIIVIFAAILGISILLFFKPWEWKIWYDFFGIVR